MVCRTTLLPPFWRISVHREWISSRMHWQLERDDFARIQIRQNAVDKFSPWVLRSLVTTPRKGHLPEGWS